MAKKLTYKDSGVSISKGEKLVEEIKPYCKSTITSGVIGSIGGFGGLFSGSFNTMKHPVLVSGTDGVGTKLKVAIDTNKHDTVGIDLVAMCVNDIIVTGARPLFFLDYFATSALNLNQAKSVIKGIAKGCKESGCALIGGETAEMPGMYKKGDYDLAGFCVGVVDKKDIIDGTKVRAGDIIIGLASSGIHSNGLSLARKVIFEKKRLKPNQKPKGLTKTIKNELLTPTKIYVKTILKLIDKFNVSAIAHITGGGFEGNIPRVLKKEHKALIYNDSWKMLPIFKFIEEHGNISRTEMLKTFNCGIGMAIVINKNDKEKVLKFLKSLGEKAYVIGEIQKRVKKEKPLTFIDMEKG